MDEATEWSALAVAGVQVALRDAGALLIADGTDDAGATRPGRMTITQGWVAAAKRGAER